MLKGVSFDVAGGEKVGLVGRTGSGKSSLLLALFRMVEPDGGSIRIDGVDIATLGLARLRGALSIIPQDPFMFSGTVRRWAMWRVGCMGAMVHTCMHGTV